MLLHNSRLQLNCISVLYFEMQCLYKTTASNEHQSVKNGRWQPSVLTTPIPPFRSIPVQHILAQVVGTIVGQTD
jgi:hypothetical protein